MTTKTEKASRQESSDAAGTGSAVVYYDGACPLCRAEISHYKEAGSNAEFVDISDEDTTIPDGETREDLLGRFHVRTRSGEMVSGARAFTRLWAETPGWRRIAPIAGAPPFVWILEAGYRLFLPLRPLLVRLFVKLKGS